MFSFLKKLIIGSPIPNWRALSERLPKFLALPVFASDAISSVGYATEEILLALVLAGTVAVTDARFSVGICLAIIGLLTIVVISYRQTIYAYPSGGGSYIVAKDNLGTGFGLLAGSALLIDYVLTVSVSVCSGVAAIVSFVPHWQPYMELIALGVVAVIAIANLRGMRESGALFAFPTYAFVGSAVALVGIGLYHIWRDPSFSMPAPPAQAWPHGIPTHAVTGIVLVGIILRAFSSGCSAMTGTEAISNGIPAFRRPESKNAATTLVWMAAILIVIFGGVTFIAWWGKALPMDQQAPGYQTVLSQIASALVGRSWFYYLFQGATAGILVIAANTSFADFPRLGSIMARDRFLPRQLYNVGDRLVFQNGIIALSMLAGVLIVVFHGEVSKLIPLYAIGVFMSFTLSQWGMAKRFIRLKETGWRHHAAISGFGAVVTATVVVIQAVTKFNAGAKWVLLLIPMVVWILYKIHEHYISLGNELRLTPDDALPEVENTVLVLTPSIHKGILPALSYARGLSPDVRAIHVDTDRIDAQLLEDRWEQWAAGIPLVVLESPYRSLIDPLLRYIDAVRADRADGMVTVVIPEFVTDRWWHSLLHNQSGLLLKLALMRKEGVTTTNMRFHVRSKPRTSPMAARKGARVSPSSRRSTSVGQ